MTPEDLLRVEPEVLAKLILHKRERVSQSLPKMIDSIAAEKQTAEKLARRSRDKKEDIEPKFNNLIKERNQLLISIPQAIDLENLSDNEVTEFNQFLSQIQSSEINSEDYLQYLEKLTNKCLENGLDIKKLDDYNLSIKANNALYELSSDYEIAKNNWNENEAHRRRLESKFTKLSSNLKDSDAAKNYWQEKLNSNFDELLVDAKRVADGGPSSRQLSRNRRLTNNRRRG
jgi:hypothetical protein